MIKEGLSTREFLKLSALSLGSLAESILPPSVRKFESESSVLRPGDPAPLSWGGAGVFDLATCYIVDPYFYGQVLFAYKIGKVDSLNQALIIVCGTQKFNNEWDFIQGATFIDGAKIRISDTGLDVWVKPDVWGDNNAQLSYNPFERKLDLSFDLLPVTTPQGETKTLLFHPVVRVPDNRSNILAENSSDDDRLRHYMRAGHTPLGNSDTRFFMMTHASLRAWGDDLYIPDPPDIAFDQERKGFLTVIQKNPRQRRVFTWLNEDFVVDPQAEYLGEDPAYDSNDKGSPIYYMPTARWVKSSRESGYYYQFKLEFPDISTVDEFAFPVPIPDLDFSPDRKKMMAFPTIGAYLRNEWGQRVDVDKVTFMAPTESAIYQNFLPLNRNR